MKTKRRVMATCAVLMTLTGVAFAEAVDTARPAPGDEGEREALRKAVACRPHERQVMWQQYGLTAFIHYGINTFNDVEWGDGKEHASEFKAETIDCAQWARELKNAGVAIAILTAKHHDGFCLWPSRYTEHSVKNSPYKGGQGDVMKEFADACRAEGLKVGVYVSPADLYQLHTTKVYGGGSPYVESTIPTQIDGMRPFPKGHKTFTYTVDDYNRYFLNQLYELLTEYGPIDELWLDGANPQKADQLYAGTEVTDMMRTLHPNAVVALGGPDVRWAGNESGIARKNEWSPTPVFMNEKSSGTMNPFRPARGGNHPDTGSRAALNRNSIIKWHPAECDVSIRKGWFFHADEEYSVRSPDNLMELYESSVGRNSLLLLNVPPNQAGRFDVTDVASLRGFAEKLRNTYGSQALGLWENKEPNPQNFLHAKGVEINPVLIDRDVATLWIPETEEWSFTFSLPAEKQANRFMIRGNIRKGQVVEKVKVEAEIDGAWTLVTCGRVVGHNRIYPFPAITAKDFRITIEESRATPFISEVGLFYAEVPLKAPEITREANGKIKIAIPGGLAVHYTTDGSKPTGASLRFTAPFAFDGGTVRACAVREGKAGEVAAHEFGIPANGWKVIEVSSERPPWFVGKHIHDGKPLTWATEWKAGPHHFVLDLGKEVTAPGFFLTPHTDKHGNAYAPPADFSLYVGNDPENFGEPFMTGTFDNIVNNPVRQRVLFDQSMKARYIKMVFLKSADGKAPVYIREFELMK